MSSLLPPLYEASAKPALCFGDQTLSYALLRTTAERVAARVRGAGRVAVWATPTLHTCVGVLAGLLAGVPVVPVNPRIGERELAHIVGDSAPGRVLVEPGVDLPRELAALPRVDVELPDTDLPDAARAGAGSEGAPAAAGGAEGPSGSARREADGIPVDEEPALIIYTSGTTGPPKGVLLPRRALAATLDAVADAWRWTADDVLVHGLPLFHVHGLVLGVLGPLRRGGTLRHLGRFSPEAVARELGRDGTVLFGVPTMYHRLAEAADDDPAVASALRGARLLVSGSAALPLHDHERITAVTGQRVVERYGMTETLMSTSVRLDGERRAGSVGVPLPGVDLRLVDEAGAEVPRDGESVGEVQVRGPQLFTGYLNRPDATAAAFDGDWFRSGDMAVWDDEGWVRIVGRKATDLIKSGGYKIGAGEIENALLDHPHIAEAAVTGEPDPDLGERIVAWVVVRENANRPSPEELGDHVARLLAPHKRPRVVHFRPSLPRNDLGKLLKRDLA